MMELKFEPVPGIWRFHLIYLVVTGAIGWSFFPYSAFASLFLISGVCIFGIFLAVYNQLLATHILALAIGLGTPVVVLAGLRPLPTLALLSLLIFGIILGRKILFGKH
ncbi:MAG TPA: hypothetical protein VGD99_18785 [Anaerolineae bacterium]|jgi:hypothetical protein